MTKKIFIGSSSEAEKSGYVAEVARIIRKARYEPLPWNDGFPVGALLMNTLDQLPREVYGAVLLATPDEKCERQGVEVCAPVPNVIFEYGFLSARLTPRRVALCKFHGADLPSDLGGMKVIEVGASSNDDASHVFDVKVEKELVKWLKGLPTTANGISPICQANGYSGRWTIANSFSRWRGHELGPDEEVYFEGECFLIIPDSGEGGTGVQVGKLSVRLHDYRADFFCKNDVLEATVGAADGALSLRVVVRERIEIPKPQEKTQEPQEAGPDPDFDVKGTEFKLTLKPEGDQTLKGHHEKPKSTDERYQFAEETYKHIGFGRSASS